MDMINLKNNMLMNKKKSLYEAPTTDVLVVRFEGALLQGSNGIKSIEGDDVEDNTSGWGRG